MDVKKHALESIPNTIVQIFNKNFVVIALFGRKKIEEIGMNKSIINGKSIEDIYESDIVALYKPFWAMALDGNSNAFEMMHDDRMWHQTFSPILDEKGAIIAGMAISKDVTEKHEKEKLIKKHQNILEKISFIASHKFRAPVARLDGLLSLIMEYKPEFSEDVLTLLKTMSLPIKELYDIIESIDNLTDEDY